jgi:hypothetical protein
LFDEILIGKRIYLEQIKRSSSKKTGTKGLLLRASFHRLLSNTCEGALDFYEFSKVAFINMTFMLHKAKDFYDLSSRRQKKVDKCGQ